MKIFHVLLGVLLFLVLLAAGLGVLSMAFQGEEAWQQLVRELDGRRVEAILIGIGLVFAVLLYALTALRLPDKAQYLAYDIEGGTVSISLKAVENFVSQLANEFAAVDSLEPTLRARNGTLDVQLDVKVKAGAQIPELCRMLQERARSTIREKVGISEVREVRVRVQEITGTIASGETQPGEIRPESYN
jgi:uncharacterized alkaline shock family protein YloU